MASIGHAPGVAPDSSVQDQVTMPLPSAVFVSSRRVSDPDEYTREQLAPGVVCNVTSPVEPRVTGDRTWRKAIGPSGAVADEVGVAGVGGVAGKDGVVQPPARAVRPIAQQAMSGRSIRLFIDDRPHRRSRRYQSWNWRATPLTSTER